MTEPVFSWDLGRDVRPNAQVPSPCEHGVEHSSCTPCMWAELYRLRDEIRRLAASLEAAE